MASDEQVVELMQTLIRQSNERMGFIIVKGQTHMQHMQQVWGVVVQDARKELAEQTDRINKLTKHFNGSLRVINERATMALNETARMQDCSGSLW